MRRVEIPFSQSKVLKLIGVELDAAKITQILELLDFEIKSVEDDFWTVSVPSYRVDVTRDVDVAEELLRIYGFNEVPVPDQMRISVAAHEHRPEKIERSVLDPLNN